MSQLSNKEIIERFLKEVRSGILPENASKYMADKVLAHQLNAENQQTVSRNPDEYAAHVREFKELFGDFQFTITELLAEDDKVYARWEQHGHHLQKIGDFAATGMPITEIASAVYRLEGGKIVEYWIQIDRQGFDKQLLANASIAFEKIDWDALPKTTYAGETGTAYWTTAQYAGLRLRKVEYTAGYMADHWCKLGHVVHCLSGSFVSESADGESQYFKAGESFIVSDNQSIHRSKTETGTELLIIDGEFLNR